MEMGAQAVAKKKQPPTKQVAFRAPEDVVERLENVARRLGLDLSNFMRLMVVEQVARYERRAERAESGEDSE
jgi:antitoxin component of RelBE/YafQ-DinJ toxin-antitoxin module